MRSILPTAGLLLALGGCSQLPQPSVQPSSNSRPMAAQILPRSALTGLRFHVSRPAYAALYQIVPGAGVSQLYPSVGTGNMEGRVFAGYTPLHPVRLANIEQYSPAGLSLNGPRFYFLITSDRPLDIDRFGTFGIGLRRELGVQFTGFNAFETMERIAEMTIPVPEDRASWSTDLYVEWPNVLYNAPVPGLALVPLHCGTYQMYVPIDRLMEVEERVCYPERSESPAAPQLQPQPSDSARSMTPKPRTPVPPAGKPAPAPASPGPADQRASNAVREGILASAQLESGWDGGRAASRGRAGLQRSTEGRERVRPGRDADASGRARGVSSGGANASTAAADAAAARAAQGSTQSSSSTARQPQPAATPSPAPAPAPSAPASPPAPHPDPVVRGESNGR